MTPRRRRLAAAAIFLGVTLLYYAYNPRLPDAYKHHVYVADAWLHGRLWVSGYPPHYHDWITVDGKVHSPFAPAPAILLLPFVWWWGTALNMNAFSIAVAGLNAALCWLVLLRVGVGPRRAALGTLIFAFGTVNWCDGDDRHDVVPVAPLRRALSAARAARALRARAERAGGRGVRFRGPVARQRRDAAFPASSCC